MRIALISMPWASKDLPSAAVTLLAPYIRQERPGHEVYCHHACLKLLASLGMDIYDALSTSTSAFASNGDVCELLYLALLYPDRRPDVKKRFAQWASEMLPAHATSGFDHLFETVMNAIESNAVNLADALCGRCDLAGCTTQFKQLFPSLLICKLLKERDPKIITVLGGVCVSGVLGLSILREYAFVDYIVDGEGEDAMISLIDELSGKGTRTANVIGRGPSSGDGKPPTRLDLDRLALPDFDDFAALTGELDISWGLTVEYSRGCWWDRRALTGDTMAACRFCGLTGKPYRKKTTARFVQELVTLGRKYKNLQPCFTDDLMPKNPTELLNAISGTGMEFTIFSESRVGHSGRAFMAMREAGVHNVQFGIEGLSNSYLRRIGKGTTTIQNLHAMRFSKEFGINVNSNLLLNFPGSTEEEVRETCSVISDYAFAFQPLLISMFKLSPGSPIDANAEQFGVRNVRNAEFYRIGMPEDVWQRLILINRDYDLDQPCADWTPVVEEVRRWNENYRNRKGHVLTYRDGGSFLILTDERSGELSTGEFDALERAIYLYCTEIRTLSSICEYGRLMSGANSDEVQAALDKFLSYRLMYAEDGHYLSLAVAVTPELAMKRISQEGTFLKRGRP